MESPVATPAFQSAGHQSPANDNGQRLPLSRPTFPAGTLAYIHRPSRSAMSSGPAQHGWQLEFEPRTAPFLAPLMGWTGSRDPLRQVALTFPTLDAALSYAERQGLRAVVWQQQKSLFKYRIYLLKRSEQRAARLYKAAGADGSMSIAKS